MNVHNTTLELNGWLICVRMLHMRQQSRLYEAYTHTYIRVQDTIIIIQQCYVILQYKLKMD